MAVALAASGLVHAGEESGGASGGGVSPASAALSSSPPASETTSVGAAAAATALSAACSQPLEEVNPSILNASSFSPGGGGSGGYGAGSGKEEGRTPPAPAVSSQVSPSRPEEVDGGGSPATVGGDGLRVTEGSMTSGGAAGASAVPPGSLAMSGGSEGAAVGGGSGGALPTPPARGVDAAPEGVGAVTDRRAAAAAAASLSAVAAAGSAIAGSPARGVRPPTAGAGGVGGDGGGGALEDPGSRLKGKSVEAKGSTGVSPMPKRNRRELKVCLCVLFVQHRPRGGYPER